MSRRLRNVCWTLNNPTKHNGLDLWHKIAEISDYYVIGYEVGEAGTEHWQGYCELKKQTAFDKIRKLNAGWHIEARKSTSAKKAMDYCKKDGLFVEEGKITEQGERVDIDLLRKAAQEGGMARVSLLATSMQQYRLTETYMNFHAQERDRNQEVYVTYVWGASGSGKSRLAFQMLENENKRYYIKDAGPWWTGYDGQPTVLLDDFRDSWMPHNDLIKLLDRYPMRVRVHGGVTQMRATRFILTSVFPPESLYARVPDEPKAQVLRRIKEIIHTEAGEIPSPPAFSGDSVKCSEVGVILDPTSYEQNVGHSIDEWTG